MHVALLVLQQQLTSPLGLVKDAVAGKVQDVVFQLGEVVLDGVQHGVLAKVNVQRSLALELVQGSQDDLLLPLGVEHPLLGQVQRAGDDHQHAQKTLQGAFVAPGDAQGQAGKGRLPAGHQEPLAIVQELPGQVHQLRRALVHTHPQAQAHVSLPRLLQLSGEEGAHLAAQGRLVQHPPEPDVKVVFDQLLVQRVGLQPLEVLAHLQGVGAQAESVLGGPATVAVGHVGHELVLRCLFQTEVEILMGGGHCLPP